MASPVDPQSATDGTLREVAFVDTSVTGWEGILRELAATRPAMEVVVLDHSDGLAQMAAWSATHQGYDAIHAISHGAEGELQLGKTLLNADALKNGLVQTELKIIGGSLTGNGDILLYGCDTAEGSAGDKFISQIAQLTGADVAASTDLTGAAAAGGDWVLEARTGAIEAPSLSPIDFSGTLDLTNPTSSISLTTNSNVQFGSAVGLAGDRVAFETHTTRTNTPTGGSATSDATISVYNADGSLSFQKNLSAIPGVTVPGNVEVNMLGLANGNIVVEYNSYSVDPSNYSRNGNFVILDLSGNLVTGPVQFNQSVGSSLTRFVSMDELSNGDFVIGYQRNDNVSSATRIYHADGTPVGNETLFFQGANNPAYSIQVEKIPSGYAQYTQFYQRNILQFFDNSGHQQGSTITLSTNSDQYYSLFELTNGNLLVTEHHSYGGGGSSAQLYDGTAHTVLNTNVDIDMATGYGSLAVIRTAGNDGYVTESKSAPWQSAETTPSNYTGDANLLLTRHGNNGTQGTTEQADTGYGTVHVDPQYHYVDSDTTPVYRIVSGYDGGLIEIKVDPAENSSTYQSSISAKLFEFPAAHTFTITSLADDAGDTTTGTPDGNGNASGTLREAINFANQNVGNPSVVTTIVVQSGLAGTITLKGNLPLVATSIDFDGGGLTVDGASAYRGFLISGIAADGKSAAATTVSISDLTIAHVKAQGGAGGQGAGGGLGAGGAFFIGPQADVTLTDVSVTGATAAGGSAGPAGYYGGGGGLGGNGGSPGRSVYGGSGGGGLFFSGGAGSRTSEGGAGGGGGGIGSAGAAGAFNGGAGGSGLGGLGGGGGGGGDLNLSNGSAGAGGAPGGTGANGGTSGNSSQPDGGSGGFGGGGGGAGGTFSAYGGRGGFGAGGGGGDLGGGDGGFGGGGGGGGYYNGTGAGGFGGGGGGVGVSDASASGGFGGGHGDDRYGGGGGAAMGGAVFVAAGGTLTIAGASSESGGGLTPGQGAGGGGGGGAYNAGIFYEGGTAAAPAVLTFSGTSNQFWADSIGDLNGAAGNTTTSNGLGGTGGVTALVKTGSFTLTLAGANTYTGATTVSAGTLQVDGSIANSAVTVKNNATIGGFGGTTGALTVEANGHLAPGHNSEPGALHTGDLSLASTARVNMAIDNGAYAFDPQTHHGYSYVDVTGKVALNGASLILNALGTFAPSPGQSYKIIDNDGTDAVVGTFQGLAEGATVMLAGQTLTISYAGGDGNDVVLTDPAQGHHAPTTSAGSATFLEDATYTFKAADFPFGDAGDSPADSFFAVIVTSLPSVGTLSYNGTAITASQAAAGFHVAAADIGKLTYKPASNGSGSGYASFQFEVQDDGGTGGGGSDSSAPATFTLNVTAVNDAPTASVPSTAYAATEGVSLNLKGTGLSVSDSDGGSGIETATLSVGQGALFVTAGNSGAQVLGTGTNSVQITGTTTQINAVLGASGTGTLTYTNASDVPAASVPLTLRIQDNGNTGSGGTLRGSASGSIAVTAVDDAPTFAVGDGKTTTAFGTSYSEAYSVARQADGKIVLAGYSAAGATSNDFTLTRYNADGSLDTSFGTGGKVVTPIGPYRDQANDVTIQLDGKIVVAGTNIYSTDQRPEFALTRYNTDGSLDTSFGTSGVVTTRIGPSGIATGHGVAVQPDGAIIVAGDSYQTTHNVITLARYGAGGSLDTSFGSGGVVTTSIGSTNSDAARVVVQPDGKIVVAGGSIGSNVQFALARYDADGSPDTTFGSGGVVTTFVGASFSRADSLVLQPDGKIVAAGTSNDGGTMYVALTRYNADGSLDTGFGTGGKVLATIGSQVNVGSGVTLQPDGKILVAGTTNDGSGNDFALIRFNADGSLDTSFGTGGKVSAPIGAATDDGYAIVLEPDGKIVVAGASGDGSSAGFAVARFNADGSLDTTFHAANTLDGAPHYTEGGSAVVLDGNAKIFDAELHAAGSYSGAGLTLARSGGADTHDVFGASGTLSALDEGGALVVGGVTVGTVTQNSGGTLTLAFSGANATEANVDAVMQQITYANSSDTPPASADIAWSFSDGNAGTQGTGGAKTALGHTVVSITALSNDAPTATGLTQNLPLNEDAAATKLFTTAPTVSDADGDTLTATLTLSDAAAGVLTGAGTGIPGTGTTTVYTIIGTAAQVQAKLATVQFDSADNYSGTPSVAVAISDGNPPGTTGTEPSGTVSITVNPVNDPPTLSATGTNPTYTEGGAAVDLFSNVSVSTVESGQTISGAVLTVSNVAADGSDHLTFGGLDVPLNQYSTSAGAEGIFEVRTVNGTATVTFRPSQGGQYTEAQFKDLIDGLTYYSASQNPSAGPHVVTLTSVTDNGGTDNSGQNTKSLSISSSITVTPVNDAPTAQNLTQSLRIAEDAAATPLFTTAPTVNDVDSTSLTATLVLANPAVGTLAGGGFTATGSAGTYTFTGTAAQVQSALAAVTFDSANDVSGTTNVSVAISDGNPSGTTGTQPSGTVNITITAVNDDPRATGVPSDVTVTSGIASNVDLSPILFTDVDSGSANVTFTIKASAGTLSAASGGSVTVTGAGTGTLTLTGLPGAIDTFLNDASRIKYTSAANALGDNAATLTLTANDRGQTGSGGGRDVTLGTVHLDVKEVQSLVVTTLSDTVDAFDGQTSLREAIAYANAHAGADTITFASNLSGTIPLDGGDGVGGVAGGTLSVTEALTIDGAGRITISGDVAHNDATRAGTDITDLAATSSANLSDNVRLIDTASDLTLKGLTLTGGYVAGKGGAVNAAARTTVTIEGSTVAGNGATGDNGYGGGICGSTINAAGSTFSDNHAGAGGGGLIGSTVSLTNSTVGGNSSVLYGGGLSGIGVALTNTTVTGNVTTGAGGYGGGVYGEARTTVTNSIVLGNVAKAAVGDEIAFDRYTSVGGNIIGRDGGGGADVFSGATDIGDTDAGAVFARTVDIGGGVIAGVLADNGGKVQTVALKALATNPALDAADGSAPAADARGFARVDQATVSNGAGGTGADLGAYELQGGFLDATPPTITINPIAGDDVVTAAEGAATITVSGTAAGAEDGQTVTLRLKTADGASTLQTLTTTVSGGAWHLDLPPGSTPSFPDGQYRVTADVSDRAGNPATEATRTITVDTHAPSVTINAIAGDDVVNAAEGAATITVSGTAAGAEDGQTVTLALKSADGATTLQTLTTSVSGGAWHVDLPPGSTPAFPDGQYRVTADVSDRAGNPATEATRTITVDTHAPDRPTVMLTHDTGISSSDGITSDASLSVTTAEAGWRLSYGIDGAAVASYDPTTLSQGAHTVSVTQTDAAGNVSAAGTLGFTLDTVAPAAGADMASGIGYASALTGNVLANDSDASALHVGVLQFSGGLARFLPATGSVSLDGVHGSLTLAADGSYTYHAYSAGSDVFTYTATDAAGNTSQTTLGLSTARPPAPPASQTFAFALTDAVFDFSHGRDLMTTPTGTVIDLTGIGTLSFTDGTVQENDGNPLVDDLFYYATNLDVWRAHADADLHYHLYGWQEGRDPNADFSTKGYLAANPDVAAARTDPLQHYDAFGWKEGRSPGPNFSAEAYLAQNPDVAAAKIDPLLHYLAFGQAEGRATFAGETRGADGHRFYGDFDADFYLAQNPDVAAAASVAHVSADSFAYTQYLTLGWREGRDPDALFSTNGYLAANPDVAASGINPLLHYETAGWHEGRDPSSAFHTNAYLAAHPDIATAQIDPLGHYLKIGFADGHHIA